MQKIRNAFLILSFIFFPITLYYFSPYLIVQAAFFGILAGSGIVFLSQFLTSLIFGRFFCGWVCPAAGLQEISFKVNNKKSNLKYGWIKYAIWINWIGFIAYLFIKAGGIKEIRFLYENDNLISVDQPSKYLIYYAILFLFLILSFIFGKRAFCHYGCWMAPFMIIGTKIKNKVNIPSLYISVEKEKCISCMRCNNVCTMSLDVEKMVQNSNMYNSECVLCGECITVCPKDVLKYKFGNR